ncbi:MAG: ribosomal protein L11 methyltransferase [Chloroflexi bacterium RBG_13_66_10]|nr:MAG: ribosomal protein L11 methyltransferase [Chloroflexi bacterium RBG_13_66_10]
MRWVEVSLTLEPELADPVAELLARYAPGGVSLTSVPIEAETGDGRPADRVTVRAYLASDADLASRRQGIEEGLWFLGRIRPLPQATFVEVEEIDWAERWKDRYHPIRVGRRLVIVPAWLEPPGSPSLPILLDPGMAFGTGAHPTTRLVLAALEDYLVPGQSVADLGCGSGVLSIAACRLGAGRILALDIDPEAVRSTETNAAGNGMRGAIQIRLGSLDVLLAEPPVDLLLANILASVLEEMLGQGLAPALKPDGVAILSGILETQVDPVVRAAERAGLELVETRAEEDWRALVLKRPPPP